MTALAGALILVAGAAFALVGIIDLTNRASKLPTVFTKTVGWVLVAGGIALMVLGGVLFG